MNKQFILIGACIGAFTVGLGAFGAHALKAILSATALTTYETGVRYQFYHCIALILVGIIYQAFPSKWLCWSGRLFIAGYVKGMGIVVFIKNSIPIPILRFFFSELQFPFPFPF